jgi:hypothetical protein
LPVLPVLLPAFTAMLLLLIGDRDSLPRLRRIGAGVGRTGTAVCA